MSTQLRIAFLAALLIGGSAAGRISAAAPPPAGERVPIHVVSHGWHTGIVIPLDAEAIALCPPLADFRGNRYVELGWGDEGFYRAERISAWTTIRAIGWPTPSVMHAVGFSLPPAERYLDNDLVRLEIDREAFRALVAELAGHFAEREPLGPGVTEQSLFYRATEGYWFLNTCNVWTLRTLAVAGVPTSPAFGIRSEVAMAQIARHGTPIRLAPRESKWPYGLAVAAGVAIARLRRLARARREPPPARDTGLRSAWLAFLLSSIATLLLVVLSANGHDWARFASRIGVGAIVAALGAMGFVAADRLRSRARAQELASGLLALVGCALVLSPL